MDQQVQKSSEQPASSGALSSRYLTPGEKARELAEFEDYKRLPGIWRRDHADDHGGTGRVDHEVLALVDDLNALEGVCTIQSCCGHRWQVPGEPEGVECVHNGQLWLRCSGAVLADVQHHVGDLLAKDVIVHVQRLYSFRDGTEPHDVLDIQWEDGRMDEAHRVIAGFFRTLTPEAA